jgi:SAM-dependent methyltransferase
MGALLAGSVQALLLALLACGLAHAVRIGFLGASLGGGLAIAVMAADQVRAHFGMNPQVSPAFFELLPEVSQELDEGRVFSWPLAASPSFSRYLATGAPGLRLASFFVTRQALAPYLNVLDQKGAPDDRDLASFTPRPGRFGPEDYRPDAVATLVPWMRQAGVTRVLSLDPLSHEDLELRADAPLGPPNLRLHVYALARPAPAQYVACRISPAASQEEAASSALRPGFDPERDASLEQEIGHTLRCSKGEVSRTGFTPARREYEVNADGAGLLVERENTARGWRAEVDGQRVAVLRANGKNRAVPFPSGRHRIVLRYEAPGLFWGALMSAGSVLLTAALLWTRRPPALLPSGGEPELRLLCPACRAELPPLRASVETDQACPRCLVAWPVRDGVLDLRRDPSGAPGYDPHYFSTLPAVEDRHFWFVARREHVFDSLLRAVPDLAQRALFDVGCGSGHLLSWLRRTGLPVVGAADAYPEGLAVARKRLPVPLVLTDLATPPPLVPGQTLISFFDVLEHLDDDEAALAWACSTLAPGGVLVATVPAHPFLFDEMDQLAHHRRRYRRKELHAKLRRAGFEIRYLGYFMAMLVPLLVLVRGLGRLRPGSSRDSARRRGLELSVLPGVNEALLLLLRAEQRLGRLVPLPFGTSLLAVAARPASGSEASPQAGPQVRS